MTHISGSFARRQRHAHRLSDKILIAFHSSCDQGDIEIAGQLLDVLEFVITRPANLPASGDRRAASELALFSAHERLWHLRHPDAEAEVERLWHDAADKEK